MFAQIAYGVVLGIVQGIAEFLPISSSGHLVILQQPLEQWLGIASTERGRLEFDIVLHFGTLIALFVFYWRDLLRLPLRHWTAIVIGTIPVGIIGLLFHDQVEAMFNSPLTAGVCLLGTASLLFSGQNLGRGTLSYDDMSPLRALWIGLFQAVAILPGLSRSGSTIAGACLVGFQRDAAARFSFFLAIPAISGACVVTAAKFIKEPVLNNSTVSLITGGTTAMIVGLVSLPWLIRTISKGRLHWFAWYCVAVGSATIAWQLAVGAGVL